MNTSPEIPVLIPTVATTEREPYLVRALDSLDAQEGCRAVPVVVVNGARRSPRVVAMLAARPGVRLIEIPEAGMGAALAAGRRTVATEYFAELDDDDELLPRALASRLARLASADVPDVVVSNSVIRGAGAEKFSLADAAAVERAPLSCLMDRNWFLPGAALFRTATIPAEWFAAMPRYFEWTYLGLIVSTCRRVAFLQEPTAVHHMGHDFSVDASIPALLGRPAAFDALLALDLPVQIRRCLRRKKAVAYHRVAELQLGEGEFRHAFRAHLRSLSVASGWRFAPYTRHFLRPELWRRQPRSPRLPV